MTRTDRKRRRLELAAYAAAAWAFLFAVPSFYWAAGGSVATRTIARDLDALGSAGEPWVIAFTGVAKVVAGLVAIAPVQPWGHGTSPRLIGGLLLGGGLTTFLYGATSFVDHLVMVADVRGTPSALGPAAARWHLALWDPYWMLGGALFAIAGYLYLRAPRASEPWPSDSTRTCRERRHRP